MELLVTGLGKEGTILGFSWLQEQNPDINWKTGKFSFKNLSSSICSCGVKLYALKDLGVKMSFNSILWSQGLDSGKHLENLEIPLGFVLPMVKFFS